MKRHNMHVTNVGRVCLFSVRISHQPVLVSWKIAPKFATKILSIFHLLPGKYPIWCDNTYTYIYVCTYEFGVCIVDTTGQNYVCKYKIYCFYIFEHFQFNIIIGCMYINTHTFIYLNHSLNCATIFVKCCRKGWSSIHFLSMILYVYDAIISWMPFQLGKSLWFINWHSVVRKCIHSNTKLNTIL